MVRKIALVIALAASIAGMVVASSSFAQYREIQKYGFDQSMTCSGGNTDCAIVNASSYATFLGTPVSWWGLLFYGAVALSVLIVFLGRLHSRHPLLVTTWLLSAVALLFSLRMAYILFSVLHAFCQKCAAMYLLTALIFIALFVVVGFHFWRVSFRSFFLHGIAIVLFFGVGSVFGKTLTKNPQELDISVGEKLKAHYLGSIYPINVNPDWPVRGNPQSRVVMLIFSDFQCPHCSRAATTIWPYLREFEEDIQFRYVHLPLDKACNPRVQHSLHPYACLAAAATVCAESRNDFWGFHDELFRRQKDLNKEVIEEIALLRGWKKEEFEGCVNAPETQERVRGDVLTGQRYYISSTPSVFLNGREVRFWFDGKFLQTLIKEELKRSSKK